jgi:hypothetical protein
VVADGVLLSPLPGGQSAHLAQAWLPGVAFQCPAGQAEHFRFDVSVSAVLSYIPLAHTVRSEHSRSDDAEGGAEVYWPASQEDLCVWHLRLDVSVAGAVSNSLPVQIVATAQASPLSPVE